MIVIATQCFAPDVGGIEAVMTGLADQLSMQGKAIMVFADRVRTPGSAKLLRGYAILRFGLWRPLRRLRKRRAIASTQAHERIDGAFADSWKSVAALPPGVGPIVMLAHGSEFPPDVGAIKRRRINKALRRVRTIVASSHYTAQLMGPFLDGVTARIVVINPPTNDLPEPASEALAAMDARIGGRGPVITTLARLEPRKGVDAVLRALPSVLERHPALVYCVAGAGDDLQRLKGLTRQLRLEPHVAFLGEVIDPQVKAALLARTTVYVMPSRRVGNSVEGFGISYVEAGWYGAPSVAGADGGASEVVIHGVTGLICRSDDDASVAAALLELLDNPALAKTYGAAAAQRARANFTWAMALPRYMQALDAPAP